MRVEICWQEYEGNIDKMMPSVNEFYAKKQQTYEKQSDADTDSDNELLHSLTKEKKSPQSDLLLPVYHKYKTNKSQRNNKYLDNNDDDDNDSCSNCVRDKLSEILEVIIKIKRIP